LYLTITDKTEIKAGMLAPLGADNYINEQGAQTPKHPPSYPQLILNQQPIVYPTLQITGHFGDQNVFTGLMTQPTVPQH